MVDRFDTAAVKSLSVEVEKILKTSGLIRLSSAEVLQPIASDFEIETNLSDEDLKLFDAVFHWMD